MPEYYNDRGDNAPRVTSGKPGIAPGWRSGCDTVAPRRVENMVNGALPRREGGTVQRVADGRALGWRVSA